MSDSLITQFVEITGLDRDNATTILKINNNNLEEAINYHLEGNTDDDTANILINDNKKSITTNNTISGGDSGGGDSSVSENASLPDFLPMENDSTTTKSNYTDDNDDIRAPIPPIREQLIHPEYDQFSYQYNNINTRKRRLTPATFSVCPFRNFAREAEQQEEEFNNGNNHINNSSSQRNNKKENPELHTENIQQRGLLTSAKRKRLEDLFRPPSDILFLGTFQAARDHATNLNRWLIVNLQDHHEFQSQILNRDIWSDKRIREIILSHFILCQISLDNPEGIRFKTFYRVMNLPYVCILDPRTGEDKLSCDTTTPSILYNQFHTFLDDNSYGLDPNDPPFNNLQQKPNESFLSISPSTSSKSSTIINNKNESVDTKPINTYNNYMKNITSTNGNNINNEIVNGKTNNIIKNKLINNKQPLLELSEQDQLNLAIQNSLKEKRCTVTANKYYSIDDNDDDDDDEDNINDSNYNSSILLKQNNINDLNNDNNDYEKQPSYNNKTVKNNTESYVNYMGNVTDQLTKIQIRLPFGDRECLEWPSSTLLRAIVLYVREKYPTITKNTYKLISPYPKQNILELDNELTLVDAKLHPSAVLYLHPDD